MKKVSIILLILIAAILILINLSCDQRKKHKPVIIYKSCYTFTGKELPKGLFRYGYKTRMDSWQEPVEFIDSEGKYNIGDTIK